MKTLNLTLAAVVLAFCVLTQAEDPKPKAAEAPPAAAAKPFKNVGLEEFQKLAADKKNVVLDVRTPSEFAAGHIAGAVNVDFNGADFEKKIGALDKGKTYLVHCAGGVRSSKACQKLGELNFKHLFNLEPGFRAWEKAGKPVEK